MHPSNYAHVHTHTHIQHRQGPAASLRLSLEVISYFAESVCCLNICEDATLI